MDCRRSYLTYRCSPLIGIATVALLAVSYSGCTFDRSAEPNPVAEGAGGGIGGSSEGGMSGAGGSTSQGGGGAGGMGGSGAGGMGGMPVVNVNTDCSSNDLLLCYLFEDNLDDGSGNSTPLAPTSSSDISYKPGIQGQALVINPDNDFEAANAISFNPPEFTLEAWAMPENLPVGNNRAIIVDGGAFGAIIVGGANIGDDVVRFKAGGNASAPNSTFAISGGSVPANQWSHIACTRRIIGTDTSLEIFVNGSSVAQNTFTGGADTTINNSLYVGSNCCNGTNDFDGVVDNVRLFDVPRTAQQVCTAAGRTNCP